MALKTNGWVHRAAANDIDFKTRAARGSVCNPLLSGVPVTSAFTIANLESAFYLSHCIVDIRIKFITKARIATFRAKPRPSRACMFEGVPIFCEWIKRLLLNKRLSIPEQVLKKSHDRDRFLQSVKVGFFVRPNECKAKQFNTTFSVWIELQSLESRCKGWNLFQCQFHTMSRITPPFIEWRQVKFLKVEAADPPLRCNGLFADFYG